MCLALTKKKKTNKYKAKLSSNETRIQDFYTESEINYFSVAVLLISLLPKDQKLRLGINPNGMGFWHLPGQYSNDFSGAANLVQSKK